MTVSDLRRLKALEAENRRLKQIVAEQALDNLTLKDTTPCVASPLRGLRSHIERKGVLLNWGFVREDSCQVKI
jgi:hypothetical protein